MREFQIDVVHYCDWRRVLIVWTMDRKKNFVLVDLQAYLGMCV